MTDTDGSAPLRTLFPEYWKIASMVRGELSGLSDEQLDWTSDEFGWAGWSVRQQASHLASTVYRWLLVRWRESLFPLGIPLSEEELADVNSQVYDRRLNDEVYREVDEILGALDGALEIAHSVLSRVSVEEGRQMTVHRHPTPQWPLMSRAHPRGATLTSDGGGSMTLEATFRHIYYEFLTHLYNMQRIKQQIGMPAVVRLPNEGYHTVSGWDQEPVKG